MWIKCDQNGQWNWDLSQGWNIKARKGKGRAEWQFEIFQAEALALRSKSSNRRGNWDPGYHRTKRAPFQFITSVNQQEIRWNSLGLSKRVDLAQGLVGKDQSYKLT